MQIIKALQDSSDGLRWNELIEKTNLSPRTLSKRLMNLQDLHVVERVVDESARPPIVAYKLTQSIPTEGDVNVVFEALRSFNYIRKLGWFTSRIEAERYSVSSRADLAKLIKVQYSRLYPYFLWCLYYGSKVESNFTEEQIEKFYFDRLTKQINNTIHPRKKCHDKYFRKWIDLSWNDFKEKELKNQIAEAERFFVSHFPSDLQDLAESYFHFHLDRKVKSWSNVLDEFKQIVDSKNKRQDFESYYGEKIPKDRLTRFLDVLTGISSCKES